MSQATGRVTVRLGSDALHSKPGASIQIGGINREYDITDQMRSYYRERGQVAEIKATMPHFSDTDLIKLRNWKNGTAFFETDSGTLYTISNAGTANIGALANGEVEVTIMGDPAAT
jgi:hypothetical protein